MYSNAIDFGGAQPVLSGHGAAAEAWNGAPGTGAGEAELQAAHSAVRALRSIIVP